MFSVTKHYKIWFTTSGLLIAASLFLLLFWGLRAGIDFRGGALIETTFEKTVTSNEVREALLSSKFDGITIQPVSDQTLIIKTKPLEQAEIEVFKLTLTEKIGPYQEVRFESIGPTIGRELVKKAYWQIILVTLGIVAYITYAFRKIGKQTKKSRISPWHLGLAAVIALLHDLLITVGVFVVLGKYRGVEIDALFITALLTVLGFSIHDTIVVFDRVREYLQTYSHKTIRTVIDYSINSTMARSINTTSTVIFVLVAMLMFGGETIFNFVLALLVGILVGTYSSIFIASPILYLWHRKKDF